MRRPLRPSPAFAASIVIHVAAGALIARAVLEPGSLGWLLPREARTPPPVLERVRYVVAVPAPSAPAAAPSAGRAGGDGRRERADARRSAVPLVAPPPVSAPSAPTPATAQTDDDALGGTGPLVGGGGPLRGVQPRYGDARVWAPPGTVAAAPKSDKQRLDSAFAVRFKAHQDSMAVASGLRRPGDWTVARADGSKWGIEPPSADGTVRIPTLWLGRIAIPLPLGLPVRPGQSERERALRMITSDVAQQAPRRLTEDEFRKAVKQIRERKEWERTRSPVPPREGGAPESAPKAEPSSDRLF